MSPVPQGTAEFDRTHLSAVLRIFFGFWSNVYQDLDVLGYFHAGSRDSGVGVGLR